MTSITPMAGSDLLRVVVSRRSIEADGIVAFQLTDANGGSLPPFSAGAHIDVHLPNSYVRQYSLCGDPAAHHRYEIAILKEENGRGGSKSAHENLREGDGLQISHPRNYFPLHQAPHSLLLAGGIGITPLLCMARQLHSDGSSFELHYCTRNSARAAFRTWLAQGSLDGKVHFHFDDCLPEQRLDAATLLGAASIQTHLYVCGPSGFMDHVMATARALGWSDARLHHEYFAAPADTQPQGEIFQVECVRSGKVVDVLKGQSIAGALRGYGIEVPLSCEQGICGTCSVKVLSGIPDHRDHFLSAVERAANDRLLACCSRAASARLVIDL